MVSVEKRTACDCGEEVLPNQIAKHELSAGHLAWMEKETAPGHDPLASLDISKGSDLYRILDEHPDLKRAVGYMDLDNEAYRTIPEKQRPFLAARLVRQYYSAHGWSEYGAPDGIPITVGEFCKLAKIPDILNQREQTRKAELEESARRKRERS